MPDQTVIRFKCIEVEQPIGKFYIGAIDAHDILAIAFADIRRIEARDVEKIIGIQRPLSSSRVKELLEYVTTADASFPTSVILAIEGKDATYDPVTSEMEVRKDFSVAKIIDGQHRIAGLEDFDRSKKFQMNVTVFIDMDLEDQAMVFSTINIKQTKVNKSLVYDLYDYATSRSPQKTCHNIARLLNARENSPFFGIIKILGVAADGQDATLTQATFVERLMIYITRDPMGDRDSLLRGKSLERISISEQQTLIFRNMFIKEQDAEIAKIIWNYFDAIKRRWKEAWPMVQKGNIINRSTGFSAFARFLRPAYLSLADPGAVVNTERFYQLFQKVTLASDDFTPENFKPGSSGEKDLLQRLLSDTGLELR